MYNVVIMRASSLRRPTEHPMRMQVLSERSESKDLSCLLNPLDCALTYCDDVKSFRICSYANHPGGWVLLPTKL